MSKPKSPTFSAVERWAGGLRWPQLLLVTLILLGLDLVIPDLIPFVDEVLLALLALLLGSWKDKRPETAQKSPEKNVTDRGSDSTRSTDSG